jgi:hypothetical protein
MAEPQRIEDRLAITDLVVAYSHAVDEKDWGAFVDLFLPDARIDYRSAGGPTGNPAEIAAWMPKAMEIFAWSLHSISTHRVRFTDAVRATGALHVFARHGVLWEGVHELMDVSALYHDEYALVAGRWRFASRREDTRSITGGKFADLVAAGLPGLRGDAAPR